MRASIACSLLMGACVREQPSSTPPVVEPVATKIARVDLARVRDASPLGRAHGRAEERSPEAPDPRDGHDGVDAELTMLLVAIAHAQDQGFAALVDEGGHAIWGAPSAGAAAVDVTREVLATLAMEPLVSTPWLVGRWGATDGAITTAETWCPALDGRLLGDNRTTEGGREVAFEWLRIVVDERGAVYLAQPGGRAEAAVFRRTPKPLANAAEWSNPENDFPSLLHYERVGGELHVTATGSGQRLVWKWARVTAAGRVDAHAAVVDAARSLADACADVRARAQG